MYKKNMAVPDDACTCDETQVLEQAAHQAWQDQLFFDDGDKYWEEIYNQIMHIFPKEVLSLTGMVIAWSASEAFSGSIL